MVRSLPRTSHRYCDMNLLRRFTYSWSGRSGRKWNAYIHREAFFIHCWRRVRLDRCPCILVDAYFPDSIRPPSTIPICLDLGTNNQEFLDDPLYLGLRQRRVSGPEMTEFMDEFMHEMSVAFPKLLVQFEVGSKASHTSSSSC
jgi:Malic enzyme, N-terminal domain